MRSARVPATAGFFCPHDDGWKHLPEPHAAQIGVLAAGAMLCVTTLVLWLLLAPFKPIPLDFVPLLLALSIAVVLHEITRAAVFTWGNPAARRVEIVWRRYVPHLRYEGAVSRARYLAMLTAPFLAISLAPIAAAVLLRIGSGDLVLIALVNAFISGADLVAFLIVREQVPAHAVVRRQGDYLLWKPRTAVAGGKPERAAAH